MGMSLVEFGVRYPWMLIFLVGEHLLLRTFALMIPRERDEANIMRLRDWYAGRMSWLVDKRRNEMEVKQALIAGPVDLP